MTERPKPGRNYVKLRDDERVYARRKPDDPRAVRFGSTWYLPLDLKPEDRRYMPETVPDSATLEHRALCRCHVCARPQALILWRRRNRKTKAPTPG